ncbi:polysaccharide deacetylase family protein [Brucepastera parasyntrophica]|uniref:polysaccharide deacetylase family protein n=1 Tax=Brucepastera parasyntrophica TaxID=2880008 RepID=UPI00210C40D3|nr:polysaccharide deacetylase family protein [Brucepastera parasyntrophica]ULQ59642.1 polysaccharide deacetylase family protein [Brucepastera parasyntrophica]
MKIKQIITISIFICMFCISCSNTLLKDVPSEDNGSGILLSFDDYSPANWVAYQYLFEKYNAKVTFFVALSSPTSFCFDAESRGHEIGYHTIHHCHLPELSRTTFYEETVLSVNNFRDQGIGLGAFAYPYGEWEPWMHEELLQYYDIVRGFEKDFYIYEKDRMKNTYIASISIDNIVYKNNREYERNISRMLKLAKMKENNIVPITSHRIDDSDWGITPERLEYLLRSCKELNLRFYTYKDL